MLRSYGPGCDGSVVDASSQRIPDGATWIDLEEPTREEEQLVERCIGVNVPTQAEMAEIEPSSRLYDKNGTLYMTVSALRGVEDAQPTTTPIGFVLAGNRLVTIRYATPKPVRNFENHARRDPELVRDGPTAMLRLIDAIIDRLADEIEDVGATMEELSQEIFSSNQDERRIPAARLTALLTRIGRTQTLLTKIRYSAVSTLRMLSFLGGSNFIHETEHKDARHHLGSMTSDVTSLSEHASFLSDNLTFLLDASLGLISIEQNAAMKLFSWAAVVFLPPTLIAGIYGMNFEHMPELKWLAGYPWALLLMFISAVGPYLYFKRRGWI
ncbi:magnesium transporter CorA family protein [Sphingomonas limnosediminicola]|jgi:magnesium transporter|uniref:Magnesium transporter CorA family protein n=1 Tax=Sphingomonas limnosediminicola TaxID=940133 RepID=A0ABP7LH74_9SPHN